MMSKKALSKSFFLASKKDFERAGLESCFLKIVSWSRVERRIDFPVLLKPFLGKDPSFFGDDKEALPVRRLEQLRVQFTKSRRALWFSEIKNGSLRSHHLISFYTFISILPLLEKHFFQIRWFSLVTSNMLNFFLMYCVPLFKLSITSQRKH